MPICPRESSSPAQALFQGLGYTANLTRVSCLSWQSQMEASFPEAHLGRVKGRVAHSLEKGRG